MQATTEKRHDDSTAASIPWQEDRRTASRERKRIAADRALLNTATLIFAEHCMLPMVYSPLPLPLPARCNAEDRRRRREPIQSERRCVSDRRQR